MENCYLIPSFHFLHFHEKKKNHHFLEKLQSFCDLSKEQFELFQFVEKFHKIVRLHGILFLTLLITKKKLNYLCSARNNFATLDIGEMGQGACSGYLKQDLHTPQKKSGSGVGDTTSNDNNNTNTTMDLQKIAALEEQLRQKEAEIQGLQVR